MGRKEIPEELVNQIKKELAELRVLLENQEKLKVETDKKEFEEKQYIKSKKQKENSFKKLTDQVRVVERELQIFAEEYFSVEAAAVVGPGKQGVSVDGSSKEFENYIKKLDIDKPRIRSRWKSISKTTSKRQSSGYISKNESLIESISFGFMLELLEPILVKHNVKLNAILKLIVTFRNNLVAHGDVDLDEIDIVDLKLLELSCSVAIKDLEELSYNLLFD